MTVIAGFQCKDGVVLAADMLVSNTQSKSYEKKIFSIGGDRFDCYLAHSGYVSTAKNIREDLRQALAETKDEKGIIPRIKNKLREIHKDRFTKASKDEKSVQTLLIAVRLGEKWSLHCAWGKDFFPVDGYQLLGIAEDTGKAVFEPLVRANASIYETKFVAAYGLSIIKKYVDHCGGDSDIYLLESNNPFGGALSNRVENTRELESHFEFFQKNVNPLLEVIS